MKIHTMVFLVSWFFCWTFVNPLPAAAADEIVRAKIGILLKSGDHAARAASRERLSQGDLFRIYVHSEKSGIVYIIHEDDSGAGIINITEQEVQSTTLIVPSVGAFFSVDGNSSVEIITILCSPREITELAFMESGPVSSSDWAAVKKDLVTDSRILTPGTHEKPFSLAGNVRGVTGSTGDDAFIRELQVYSGKGLLVKTYEFKVEK